MLCHLRREDRQLFDLMAEGLAHGQELSSGEEVATAAASRPVLDHLVNGGGSQELATVTLVPWLCAL